MLYAVRFDRERVSTVGVPVPVVEGVRRAASVVTAAAHYAVSQTGTLIFAPGPVTSGSNVLKLTLFGRDGSSSPLDLPAGPYTEPRFSPDGNAIVYTTVDANESNLWVYDVGHKNAPRRVTFGGQNRFPVWSPDSTRLVFQSNRDGDAGLFVTRADGAGPPERLTRPEK